MRTKFAAFFWIVLAGLASGTPAYADLILKYDKMTTKDMGSFKEKAQIDFGVDSRQIKNSDVLEIEYQMENGGYCGVYGPINQNWNGAKGIKVFGRGTPGKILQITMVDAGNRHFVYDVLFPNDDWNVFEISVEDFSLNPYYQPKEAVDKSGPLQLSNIKQIQFSPTQPGKGIFFISQILVQGIEKKKKTLRSVNTAKGGHVFFNRRIDFTNLENYYQYCSPIELHTEDQVTAGVWQGYKFFNATVYLMADPKNIYLSALVGESQPQGNSNTRGNIWNGDCIELFMGFGQEVKRYYGPKDYQIAVSPGKGKISPSVWVFNLNKEMKTAKILTEKKENGYVLKAQLPISELNLDALQDGQKIFLDVAVDKAGLDGNRTLQLSWNGKGLSYMDPTQWTLAMLASNRGEAVENVNKLLQEQWKKRQNAEIQIDAGKEIARVSPWIYGINVFPGNDVPNGWMDYSEDAQKLYSNLDLTMLRYPGGDWGDEHKLEPVHLKQYMALCRRLHAEPMVQMKIHKSTPQEAAELVTYCNKQMKYKVKYWTVGNEPDFFESHHFVGEKYRAEDYARDFKAFSRAMKKADPSIKICGPELQQYVYEPDKPDGPYDKDGKSWMDVFLKECGADVDYVTFHHYPMGGGNGVADWRTDALLNTAERWNEVVPGIRKKILKLTGRNIPIGITELNSDWSGLFNGEATPDTFANAMWWTLSLGELMRQRVEMVSFFALYATGSLGIVTKELTTLPAYTAFELYKDYGDRLIAVKNNNEYLKVYASKGPKHTSIIFVNKHATLNIRAVIELKGVKKAKTIQTRRYTEYDYINNQSYSINKLPFADKLEFTFPHYSITEFIIQ